ncbi:60S ribosomal protein L13-like [Chrysoperla carnea]|uniref:60S ribosomal protein L13-like n=1 Tax=Chrysoperla carnea TaxID=189513 RepID=UPI001D08D3AC|nr:60S ribosomal protein L13-like [Chrysoperla carnea]
MSPRGNNIIANAHFHKDWQKYARTWFNQPFRKLRRHRERVRKARAIAPKPVKGPLRPIISCPSFRYNSRIRLGRGFSLEELRKAGMCKQFARSIGIAVDHRRRNKSIDSLLKNVQRLKEYKQKLILFPMKKGKKKGGKDVKSSVESPEKPPVVQQVNLDNIFRSKTSGKKSIVQKVTPAMKKFHAFDTLRKARTEAKVLSRKNKKSRLTNDLEGMK